MNSKLMKQYESEKIQAEIAKLMAETVKISRESVLLPFTVGAAVTLVIVAVVKVFMS